MKGTQFIVDIPDGGKYPQLIECDNSGMPLDKLPVLLVPVTDFGGHEDWVAQVRRQRVCIALTSLCLTDQVFTLPFADVPNNELDGQ
ncbi:MAG: hypothetical protein QG629_738 [Patescibacteria group bacterium]|nr:hypothetical protein [Candidatus Saccharibacteria bacterium]MDQ5963655.1 hypothetical protein [Patescibacteria group bacterium]